MVADAGRNWPANVTMLIVSRPQVIKGFPAGIDCCSINRDQLKGLLAQLLLAVQQNKSDSLRHTSSVHSGRLDQASWQQEDYSSAQASQQSNDLGSVSNGSAAPSAVHIQIDATADLDSRAARRSTDDKDGSNSGCRQPRRESAEPASRQLDNCAAGRLADEQQTWQLSISKQQPGTTQRTQSDLLSALSDDIESELGMLGGSHVASIRQQQLAAAPTSYSSAATVAQAEDFPAANAANKSDNSLVGDDDGDDCLTIEADFLTGDDIDLNKATDYELRLAKVSNC